ncbi:transcriptional regulator, TetR family [Faunimonas pinastri]|uniref:Transcriptional regulator, TetR family n=1 Tax=Faunimonas pinastri TaxID=1855383 RepID=A0A1H9LGK9_9HYPH|nr:TetR/AcrR family transcriptional regulator [Faunimonas pinastri]SER10498.1 transcriptional regulator, TetR family [Faunimonas pinastri]
MKDADQQIPAGAARGQSRKRGPNLAKTEATRRLLARAALEAFLEQGFSETRMSDVAARAGLAKGTTYRYFTDKTALFAEVLRGFMAETVAGRAMGRPGRDEPTRDFLMRTVPPVLRHLQASGRFAVLRLIMSEGTRFPELAETYRQVAIEPVLRLVRVFARRAERRGEIRSGALSRIPILLVAPAVLSALWNNLFLQAEPLDVGDVFEAYLDLIFGQQAEAKAS